MFANPLAIAAEAATFFTGAALIHVHRRHAEDITMVLLIIAAVAMICAAIMITPEEELNTSAEALAMADSGNFVTARGK